MANMAHIQGSLAMFPCDTFPRYHYNKDRVKILLARFEHLGFKTNSLPSDDETSIMELRSFGSTLQFCIRTWTEHYLSDSTDIIQESDPKVVILISDQNMDMHEDSVYGVILETGQHNKTVYKAANVIFSSIKELKENVDLLLERYVLSFLKELSENVSSRSNIDASSKNGEEAIERLLSDVMAVFNRSCAPRQEWPEIKIKETSVLDKALADDLFKCDDSIKGFGYQHDILQIVVDRKYTEKSFEKICDNLKRHNITKYHINYGPWREAPLCDIKVGHELVVAERRGSLGCFAHKDGQLYALTSRHLLDVAEDQNTGTGTRGHGASVQDQYVYIRNSFGHADIKFAIAERGYNIGELDIAAVKIVRPQNIVDKRLRDSKGCHRNNMIFDFQVKHEQEIKKQLQSERVHAWTKGKLPRLGNISIPIYFIRGTEYQYLVIENEFNDSEEQHAGAAEYGDILNPNAFGMPGDSGAIICSDDARGKGVHAYGMLIGKLTNTDKTMYLSLRLQDGLDQLSNNKEPQTNSCYQLC